MHKAFDIVKITVNGSISYIRHLINIAKLFENAPTYFRCIDLGHKGVSEVNLYLGGNALHILDSYHRTLVASLVKTLKYLASVKKLTAAVFFDNNYRHLLVDLVGGKASAAGQTFSSPSDLGIGRTAVNYFTVCVSAYGAFHIPLPPLLYKLTSL
jgi:hypothetical protein